MVISAQTSFGSYPQYLPHDKYAEWLGENEFLLKAEGKKDAAPCHELHCLESV
jgi:hypothetical protein